MDLFAYLLNKSYNEPTVETSSEGTEVELQNVRKKNVNELTLTKESTQDGTPSPTAPVAIDLIKNSFTITTTQNDRSKTSVINLGNKEVCGFDTYLDVLKIDDENNLLLTKNTSKIVLDGTEETWNYSLGNSIFRLDMDETFKAKALCSVYEFNPIQSGVSSGIENNQFVLLESTNKLFIKDERFTSIDELKEGLAEENITIYYALAEAKEEENIGTCDFTLYVGDNVVTNSEDADMTIKYYK